jgi:hypothetical protein
MDKAARTILYGSAGLTDDEALALIPLSKEQIVDKLMEDRRFYDTVVDFNMFFLQMKMEDLRHHQNSSFRNEVLFNQSVVVSAMETFRGGDYFKLFDWVQNYLVVEPVNQRIYIEQDEGQVVSRDTIASEIRSSIDDWIKFIERTQDVQQLCNAIEEEVDGSERLVVKLSRAGIPYDIARLFEDSLKIIIACRVLSGVNDIRYNLRAEIMQQAKVRKKAFEKLEALLPVYESSTPVGLVDYKLFDPNQIGFVDDVFRESKSFLFWTNKTNSSTNFNRRRAAYILKTYFCDDLTPVAFVAANNHSKDRHASDPGCAACHYKLDPMAGFFKTRGFLGIDFKKDDFLIHDDQLLRHGEDLKRYYAHWAATNGQSRVWNIGYIRSVGDESKNSYGEDMRDLFRIIRDSPEPKLCLTRRLAEYTLGTQQVYDREWLEHLAKEFDRAKGSSAAAFKQVFKSFVLSQTFAKADPVKAECYDFAPGSQASSLPCEISYIITKNCQSCHNQGSDLDLSQWTGEQFKHEDKEGVLLNPAQSFMQIKERLESKDSAKIMPPQHMDPVERADLFKWISLELGKTTGDL